MTATENASIVTGLTEAVYELARAGIRHRYRNASPREQFLRLAIVSLGPNLARKRLSGYRPPGSSVTAYFVVNAAALGVADLLARALVEESSP